MKKIILTFLLAMTAVFANAQISKNFVAELGALIKADLYADAVKGKLISEEPVGSLKLRTYDCKLPLTGFKTAIKTMATATMFARYNENATTAVMDDIAKKLVAFKKEYNILDSKTDKRLIDANSTTEIRKILLIDNTENVMAKIELNYFTSISGNKYFITVSISKPFEKLAEVLPKNTNPVQIGENFVQQLKALLNADAESIKGDLYKSLMSEVYFSKLSMQGFEVKLRKLFDDYTVICKPDGVSSKATIDAIFEKLIELPYTRVDSKRKPEILKQGSIEYDYRIMLLTMDRKVKVDITLKDKDNLSIEIYKYDRAYKY